MSGSQKYQVYRSDNGKDYAVKIDESNGEVANFEDYSLLYEIAGVPLAPLPKGMVMRYANVSRDGTNRKIHVGKPDSPLMLGAVISILLSFFGAGAFAESVTWIVSSVVGEKSPPRPKTADTGILDGDPT